MSIIVLLSITERNILQDTNDFRRGGTRVLFVGMFDMWGKSKMIVKKGNKIVHSPCNWHRYWPVQKSTIINVMAGAYRHNVCDQLSNNACASTFITFVNSKFGIL